MGITLFYRGRLADLTRIEDFEDRVVHLALELGGLAQIWRSQSDTVPSRVVRGVILDLAPGMETVSLLVAPEGWLIGLMEVEDAENAQLTEPPWCFAKTQFGPLEGHVALVEMFTALERTFLPDLEVRDEGGYWETRNLAELMRLRTVVTEATNALQEGLQRHGLSREAAEDPDILARHIERVAGRVHRILQRPSEHPPVTFPDSDAEGGQLSPEADEALWDQMFKHNRRQQERLQRAIEERLAQGADDDAAFAAALGDLGLEPPSAESWPDDDDSDREESVFQEVESAPEESDLAAAAEDEPFSPRERHPLLQRAMDLLKELYTIFGGADARHASALQTLYHGTGNVMGGLAQATPERDEDEVDDDGLRLVQLKRALRGAAFAQAPLFAALRRDRRPAGQAARDAAADGAGHLPGTWCVASAAQV